MTLRFLISNRARPPLGSRLWWKAWAKRIKTLPSLLSMCRDTAALRRAGARIGRMAVVQAECNGPMRNLSIGDGSVICRAMLALRAPMQIGANVVVNDGVRILTGTHDLTDPEWKILPKNVVIEDYAWIAEGALVLPGVRVGRGAVVGAGAVVTRDVEPYSVVCGNPAAPTRTRRVQELTYSPAAFMSAHEAWLGRPTKKEVVR